MGAQPPLTLTATAMQRLKIQQNPETGAIETSVGPAETPAHSQAQTLDTRQSAQESGNDRRLSAGLDLDGRQRQELAQAGVDGDQKLALFGRSRGSQEAEQTLTNHSLRGSFVALFEKQFKEGKIRVGVIDDFRPGETHGRNVEQRILDQMPQELRGKVEIVRYDVAGLTRDERAKVLLRAADDAQDKKIVALSVSGGINAYPVATIEKAIGGKDLTKDTARAGYDALVRINGLSPTEQESFKQLNLASGKIPVVTPVWNNDTTTMAALLLGSRSGNGIITSIDKPPVNPNGALYKATEIAGMVDVRVPGKVPNPNTSQSAPYFIGNMLGYALEEYKDKTAPRPNPQPGPRPRADGGTEPAV